MKIATTKTTASGKTNKARSSGKAGAGFSIGGPSEVSTSESSVGMVSHVGAIDSLLMIQGQGHSSEKEIAKHGNYLLDQLDTLRMGMLTGELDSAQLKDLASYAKKARGTSNDPQIETTIQEIEQRVQVELAKRGLI